MTEQPTQRPMASEGVTISGTVRPINALFSIAATVVGARMGKKAFEGLWGSISDSPKPKPTDPGVSVLKVTAIAALEAATIAGTRAAVTAVGSRGFHGVFGAWPGERRKSGSRGADAPAED